MQKYLQSDHIDICHSFIVLGGGVQGSYHLVDLVVHLVRGITAIYTDGMKMWCNNMVVCVVAIFSVKV